MYEELIKSLRLCREILHEDDRCIEFVNGSCEAFPICAYQLMEKAADAIEELSRENKEIMFRANQLEAMNDALIKGDEEQANAIEVLSKKEKTTQWISVAERLPKENGFYLCLYEVKQKGGIGMDEALGILQFIDNKWSIFGSYVVTHWFPIPEPPKEET